MDHGHSASPALSGLWIHAPIDRATTRSLARGGADLAEIGAVRCGSADRIEGGAADDQVEIGAARFERVVARRPDFRAGLSPAMLADGDAGVEVVVEPGAGTHTALGVSIDTQSPLAMPRDRAAAGCSSTSGCGARSCRLGSARC
jgi:hypothetical protein